MKIINPIEHVFFDMDGLLFDTERTAVSLMIQYNFQNGLHLPWQAFERASGRKYEDCLRITQEEAGKGYPYEKIWKKTATMMKELAHRGEIPLKPGARELLTFLQEKNINCSLVTSSSLDTAKTLLEGANLTPFFKLLITGETVTKGKPHPEIYLKALKSVNKNAEQCIALEDSLSGAKSVLAAKIPLIAIPDLKQLPKEIIAKSLLTTETLLQVKRELQKVL